MAFFMFAASFALVFSWWIPAILSGVAIFVCMIIRSFDYNDGYYVSVEEIEETERKAKEA